MQRVLLVILVLVPALGLAQPTRDLAAMCTGKPAGEDLVTCGELFLDAFNRAPTAPGADEALYNAGVMFADGHAIGAALQAFSLLRKSFPNSKLAPRALARLANLYAQVVMIDRAAEALEQYARLYAGEKDAYDALGDAIYYRRALGDDDKAIVQTKFFIRLYGAKKSAEAAAAMFALTSIYEKRADDAATLKHLTQYIVQFGVKGGRDRLVIAYAKIGQLQWRQSCPVKPVDGVCVRAKRKAGVCDGDARVERVKRDERMVKEALASLTSAIKTYEIAMGRTGGDEAVARHYYARALLARSDIAAEAVQPPTEAAKLLPKYEEVFRAGDRATEIVAASRMARISDDVAAEILATAKKPSECKALGATAAPFRENAIRAYSACLAKATELGWFDDEGARSCEVALARLAPDEFSPLRERLGVAPKTAPLVVSGP